MPMPQIARLMAFACLLATGAVTVHSKSSLAGADRVEILVVGTSLEVRLADDRKFTGDALIGAVLTITDSQGRPLRVRIDGAERDPQDPNGARWLYHLMAYDSTSGSWRNFCEAGPDGLRLGFPVGGTTKDDGSFSLSSEQLTFTCTSGAVAKCIRMGYSPWATTDQGQPLLDHFRACMRMVRADYCGDGRPRSRDGTLINIYDRLDIQVPDPEPSLTFEAAWGPNGAVCVRKTRIRGIWNLDDLRASCPARLNGRIGADCSKAKAMALPEALIFNDSRDAP